MLRAHLRYAWYLATHKYFVLVAGLRLGVPLWRLLVHDLSKLTPAEWGPYVRRFYAGRGSQWEKDQDERAFHVAWQHHYQRNPHHWEHWLDRPVAAPVQFGGAVPPATALPMPPVFVAEMVADWYGAGMAQGKPDIRHWYAQHGAKMQLHPHTRVQVEALLEQLPCT
jgi:hypothetical protein